jgi:hypothetical protein
MFRASLRQSSGGQTAFHCLWFFLSCCSCCDAGESGDDENGPMNTTMNLLKPVSTPPPLRPPMELFLIQSLASQHLQQDRKPEAVKHEEQLITNKSLFVASSWSRLSYLSKMHGHSNIKLNSKTVRWLMTVLTSFGLSVKLWSLNLSMVWADIAWSTDYYLVHAVPVKKGLGEVKCLE